jgi:predicted N-acyltransferase
MSGPPDGFQFVDHMRDIDGEEWNHLADQYESPLLDWNWLRVLEDSGSVSPDYGWIPQHLLLRRDGKLIAAAPLYVKTQSQGEFVFDYAWADVANQIGAAYYPKLVAMSPLTPAIGYRFLVDRSEDEAAIVSLMLDAIEEFRRQNRLHGFSILWPEPDFAELVDRTRFTPWQHQHFRWENHGLATFDDYLGWFNKNQRRNIRRERGSMAAQGIRVRSLAGTDAPQSYYEAMFEFYSSTNDQFGMWAARFLTEEFFLMLPQACPEKILFTVGTDGGESRPLGMAMLLAGRNQIIGRYWGSRSFVNNLHFNLCYYEPIDWAIRKGVTVFDQGLGSSNKIRRGFRAISTASLHSFADERMRTVMQMNIGRINDYEQAHIDELNNHLPFARR